MSTPTDIVKQQLVYWGQVNAAAGAGATVDYAVQNGPGLLTGGMAASVYTITMPANFTIPLNRRFVALTVTLPAIGASVQYDIAASAANTVVVRGGAFGGGVLDVSFQFEIFRIEMLP
jgi:hypothetical protein